MHGILRTGVDEKNVRGEGGGSIDKYVLKIAIKKFGGGGL